MTVTPRWDAELMSAEDEIDRYAACRYLGVPWGSSDEVLVRQLLLLAGVDGNFRGLGASVQRTATTWAIAVGSVYPDSEFDSDKVVSEERIRSAARRSANATVEICGDGPVRSLVRRLAPNHVDNLPAAVLAAFGTIVHRNAKLVVWDAIP